jgi:hypothetical protein
VSERPGAAERVVIRVETHGSLSPAGVVALEDYARELTRARRAEAREGEGAPGAALELTLEEPGVEPVGAVLEDIRAFARALGERSGLGLGWS